MVGFYVFFSLQCGVDYVKSAQKMPVGMPSTEPCTRFASFDGAAERLVYFFIDEKGGFHVLDGNHIAVLFAG